MSQRGRKRIHPYIPTHEECMEFLRWDTEKKSRMVESMHCMKRAIQYDGR